MAEFGDNAKQPRRTSRYYGKEENAGAMGLLGKYDDKEETQLRFDGCLGEYRYTARPIWVAPGPKDRSRGGKCACRYSAVVCGTPRSSLKSRPITIREGKMIV